MEDQKILIAIKILSNLFKIRYKDFEYFEMITDSIFDKNFCLESIHLKLKGIRIYFVKSIDVKVIKQYTKISDNKIIIIYLESKTDCQYEDEDIEIFSISQLQYNIFENNLIPKIEIYNEELPFKGKYPKILSSDITCKLLGIKSGYLKITRNDENESYVYIREII